MKKIFTIVLLLATVFSVNAQITTDIWGLTVGHSTKQDVRKVFKKNNYYYIENKEFNAFLLVSESGFRFGSIYWQQAIFGFYNDILMSVNFVLKPRSLNSSENDYSYLKEKLDKKYKSYCIFEDDRTTTYEDGKTRIYIGIRDDDVVQLGYENIRLANFQENEQDNDF